jgi:hypothetical protein
MQQCFATGSTTLLLFSLQLAMQQQQHNTRDEIFEKNTILRLQSVEKKVAFRWAEGIVSRGLTVFIITISARIRRFHQY